jgi:hypothetical protein
MRVPRPVWVSLGSFLLVATLAGCGGGGGDGTIDVNATGRVAVGAVGNATLDVYRLGEYGAPVLTTITSVGGTAAETGRFAFSLEDVPSDAVFLLVATGGQAYDLNEDGVLDGAPTNNLGAIHALATAGQLRDGEALLSIVSEIVYQRTRYFLQALYGDSFVAKAAASWSGFAIRSNLRGAPVIDGHDSLAFDPVVSPGALFRPYTHYSGLVLDLIAGLPVTEGAFELSREEISYKDLMHSQGIDVVGTLAYVCHRPDGLGVWDVSDVENPALLGTYDTPGTAFDVQVVGSVAYVADFDGGLQIIDVTNPMVPAFLGEAALGSAAISVHVVGSRAYTVDSGFGSSQMYVIDVSDPTAPAVLGSAPVPDQLTTIRARGEFAYVSGAGNIETFDVSDPTDPVSVGTVATDDFYSWMDLGDGHLFVVGQNVFEVFELDSPSTPDLIASIPTPVSFTGSGVRFLGTQVLAAASFDGVAVFDVRERGDPKFLGLIPTSGTVADMDREGNLIVATEGNGGLNTIAGGVPVPSGVVATIPVAGGASAVDVVGTRIYVGTTNPRTLVILDGPDPLAPVPLGSVALDGFQADDLVVGGNFVYAAQGGLRVYDVTDPTAPAFVGTEDTLTSLQSLVLDTNVLFSGAGGSLGVHDVSTPASPAYQTSLGISGFARGVAYDGSAIVLCVGFPGIVTYDATTPAAPVAKGTFDTMGAIDVALRAPFAFVTDFSGLGIGDGLRVVDYSTLTAPVSPRFVGLPGGADQVALSGDFAYVTAGVNGVNVVDVVTPASAVHTGSVPCPTLIAKLDVANGFVYVASPYPLPGLHVLRAATIAVP